MPEFKVGDRVRLEGIVVRANTKTLLAGIILDGARFPVNVSDEVMAHATLIEPERSELRAGQVWLDRSGQEVHISENPVYELLYDAEHPFYGSQGIHPPRWRSYTSNGVRFDEDETGPSYLVRLIKDVEEKKVELDLSKPVRIKVRQDVEVREVFGPSSGGFCLVERADGILDVRLVEELENIPEPKKTTSIDVTLIKDEDSRFFHISETVLPRAISKARITHTEGQSWSIEEVI